MATDTALIERVAVLENDIDMTKGTIKKLVMDIRETMNTMENPFYALKEGINVNPQSAETVPENKTETPKESEEPAKVEDEQTVLDEATIVQQPVDIPPAHQMPVESQDLAQITDQNNTDGKIELPVFIKLIKWTEQMHRKLNHEQFKEMLEAFELAGYLPEKIKKLLTSISVFNEDISVQNDVIIDLYRLNKILNHEDKEMDSTVLSMILNSENDEKEAWLRLMEKDKTDS